VRPCFKKILHKKGLVEWLKVKTLSSIPSTANEKKKEKKLQSAYSMQHKTMEGQNS
jgi:hypothetical protein